ncbi:MAG: hypothetical protein QOC96_915 [Acidobacteriota bacterium]|jgi:hypothetical protein|nr:hypothetical protein [Acidobacteriota bacterium]
MKGRIQNPEFRSQKKRKPNEEPRVLFILDSGFWILDSVL